MKKLSLHPDELRVESFDTAVPEQARGTVRAHAPTDCCTISCGGTCGNPPASDRWNDDEAAAYRTLAKCCV
ncbi:MAG TPA: hypothetical protein VF746_15050 [Longimicrobium sp.]|jgi:hypothetical protein